MRTSTSLLLVLLLAAFSPCIADESQIPIEIDRLEQAPVTEAHLAHIRTWLRENLHERDLDGIEVTIENRTHPGADYRAVALLKPTVRKTYHLQRYVSFWHTSWPNWTRKEEQATAGWLVEEGTKVERVFGVGKTTKTMPLSDDLSYAETKAILAAVARGAFAHGRDDIPRKVPELRSVSRIGRARKGGIEIRTTTGADGLRGEVFRGELKDGTFVIGEVCYWIS